MSVDASDPAASDPAVTDQAVADPTAGIADTRLGYAAGTLAESDLAATPLEQFRRWYADASDAAARGRLVEPNAMTCATVDAAGRPSARTVLLKGVAADGLRFYTNLSSRKGGDLRERPAVSLLFGWVPLQRQVAVLGTAEPVPRTEVAAYFRSRPHSSRIGASVSRQSQVARSRAEIDEAAAALADRFPDTGSPDDVPVPEGWGGFLVRVREMEFWQGRPSRLHDRLVFESVTGDPAPLDEPAGWRVVRRWP